MYKFMIGVLYVVRMYIKKGCFKYCYNIVDMFISYDYLVCIVYFFWEIV